jgi:hypothetical protein
MMRLGRQGTIEFLAGGNILLEIGMLTLKDSFRQDYVDIFNDSRRRNDKSKITVGIK